MLLRRLPPMLLRLHYTPDALRFWYSRRERTMGRKPKRTVYTTGEYGCTVAIERRGKNWYLRVWDPAAKRARYRSTGTEDLLQAKRQARELAQRLEAGVRAARTGDLTLARLFRLYRRYASPMKSRAAQGEDRRRALMWRTFLGAAKRPEAITGEEWERFQRDRIAGRIGARGECRGGVTKPPGDSCPVRPRTVQYDCVWLRAVLHWGMERRTRYGYLVQGDPRRGLKLPADPDPRRPVASHERLAAILKVADGYGYLWELLVLVSETGRRIGAVRQLQYGDLKLDQGPHGSIEWPAATDKTKRSGVVPLSPFARQAIDRILTLRPGIGEAYLFPSPLNSIRPVSQTLTGRWLKTAEKKAGVTKMQGSLWHAYRRKWATERKHLPLPDVAAAGGWKGPATLLNVYMAPDPETMYRVVSERTELREIH